MKAIYPWNNWLRRGRRKMRLRRGRDFEVQPHVMAQQVRNEASRRKRRISIQIVENVLIVET